MIDKSRLPAPTIIDKAIAWAFPMYGVKRYRARAMFAIAGGFVGASKRRRSMSQWTTGNSDADSDILPDLPTLRERSRDLIRNTPIATGIINTKVTEVVGSGLKHRARIDGDILNLSEEQIEEKEKEINREWDLFANTCEVDANRVLNFDGLTQLVYRQEKENGDVIALTPRFSRSGSPYTLKLQIIEADRLSNENYTRDTNILAGGVKKDSRGAPIEYQILNQHPGNKFSIKTRKWQKVKAFGSSTGLKNVIHYYHPTRPGQSRGFPDLSPVIEVIKSLGAYTTNEAIAAEVASLFTVFIKTKTGTTNFDPVTNMGSETGAASADKDMKLGNGLILGLKNDEEIETANPTRPNTAFDGFVLAVSRQIGAAVNLPYEILVKHFTKSYSAARASLLTAWKYFFSERSWLATNFCQEVKNIWMYEAVSSGRIPAPGFFTNPLIRRAYCGSVWIGPGRGMIKEKEEISAAQLRVDNGFSTIEDETIQINGGDWDKNHKQRVREHTKRKEAGLIKEDSPAPQPGNNETNKGDDD